MLAYAIGSCVGIALRRTLPGWCGAAPRPQLNVLRQAAAWDARQWLIDNDLWDDNVGIPPEMYDRAADTPRADADAHHYRDSITDTVSSLKLVT